MLKFQEQVLLALNKTAIRTSIASTALGDYLQNNIPVFDTLGQTPNLLIYFVTMILLMTVSLLGEQIM